MSERESVAEREEKGALNDDALQEFRMTVRGEVIAPGALNYDGARAVWNGLIDRRPAAIVRCTGVADVIESVRLARERGLTVAVRGGGHGVAGNAVCDGCVAIDLSPMKGVHVDARARTVRVGGGARWADVDRETQVFGLAVPAGLVSDTGVAGLALGGGFGWLRRKYGLTSDNLLSADVVTADGRVLTASAEENADLYWALRGGGGNFGVVTSFQFRAHPVGPIVYLAAPVYPMEAVRDVLDWLREFSPDAPDEVSTLATLWSIAPGPAFPTELHNRAVTIVGGVYAGPPEEGERLLAPARKLGEPIADLSGALPYTALQTIFDEDYPPGRLYYWKSRFLVGLGDGAIETLAAAARDRPSTLSSIDVWALGGAIGRVAADATAFHEREASYMVGIESNWDGPENTGANIEWARRLHDDLEPFATGGLYVNFPGLGEDGEGHLQSAYGANYRRLVAVKRKYDPDNLFRWNQNIRPA